MKTVKRTTISKAVALIMLIAGWVAVHFISNNVQADGTPLILVRNAVLTSPSGSINPHGEAEWQLYQSGNREIEVEIEDVTLGQGTVLNAVVDGNVIGQLIVDDRQKARLKLRTENGQSVPTVNAGSTVQVRNGTTVLVAGTFGGSGGATPSPSVSPTGSATPSVSPTSSPNPSVSPTGSPSPSPSATPGGGDLFAGLTGPTLNGVVPTGFAAYEIHSSRTELEVRVRQVNLPIGTQLTVQVNGTSVGTMSLQSGGEGRLRLRSDNGQFVPVVTAGSTISIRNGGNSILSGTFGGFSATPSPSPTATGTPGGTPSPSPSPGQGRSFEAHLTGGGMSPAVATSATGELKVSLNAAETQATVFGEFHNLGSNQTGARIESTIGTTLLVRDLGIAGGRNGNFATVTFEVTAVQVQQLRAGLWSAVITSVNNPNGEIRGNFRPRGGEGDLNGDGLNDFAVFRPSTGVWWAANADGISTQNHGGANDRVVSGDYDGDGKTDVAVYRDSNGQGVWDIKRSSDGGVTSHAWGLPSDIPVRGDFDGDGRIDPAVYRPSQGVWYVLKSDNSGYLILNWGLAEDKPVPADVDGDGKDDIMVFRPSNGVWYWLRSSDGGFGAANWGLSQDIPTPGDYDGDGKDDLAVFRPDTGVWYWYRSSDLGFGAAHWGLNGDIPVPGNYDNDGMTDIAVFRPSDGNWYVYRSTDLGFSIYNFGLSGDVPLVAR